MCCGSESLTTSSGSPASVSKSEKEAAELMSLENLTCHINHDKAPHAFLASANLSDSSGSPNSHLSVLQLENSSSQSDTEINSSACQHEDRMASMLKNEIYEAFIKYRRVIGRAFQPFVRLDPARSCEDFMQEAFIPFCKGYYYCSSDKVEKSKATNLIYNCVRHYFVDQYTNWSVFQEDVSNHNRNSLWKESNNLPGPCRRISAET
ncbi:MAG: hypothetical protein ACLP9S_07335 [Syntrophales bacterium]|jgi:hypothetical protein